MVWQWPCNSREHAAVYNQAAYGRAAFAAQSGTQMEVIYGKAAGVAHPPVCVQDSVLWEHSPVPHSTLTRTFRTS